MTSLLLLLLLSHDNRPEHCLVILVTRPSPHSRWGFFLDILLFILVFFFVFSPGWLEASSQSASQSLCEPAGQSGMRRSVRERTGL